MVHSGSSCKSKRFQFTLPKDFTMVKSWHLTCFVLLLYLVLLYPVESGITKPSSLSTYVFQSGEIASVYFPSICVIVMVLQTLPLSCGAAEDVTPTLNALIPGDITLGGLFPIHDKSTDPTMPCGRSINAERGIQVIAFIVLTGYRESIICGNYLKQTVGLVLLFP